MVGALFFEGLMWALVGLIIAIGVAVPGWLIYRVAKGALSLTNRPEISVDELRQLLKADPETVKASFSRTRQGLNGPEAIAVQNALLDRYARLHYDEFRSFQQIGIL